MAEIYKHRRTVTASDIGIGRDVVQVEFDRGGFGALIEHTAVADHDEAGFRRHLVRCKKFCGQFRADAGRIAHGERDDWFHGNMPFCNSVTPRIVTAAPSFFRSFARSGAASGAPRPAAPGSSPAY